MALTPDQLSALISRLVADSALWHTIVHGGAAETVETEGGTRPSIAKALADLAGGLVSAFSASSTSEVVVGTGAKTFTIAAGKLFQPGMPVVARSASDPTLVMYGDVVSLANTVLTVDVTAGALAGSADDWMIAFSGPRGEAGIPGLEGEPGPSAYQVAVANGFAGDQAAWLASLHGADGASDFADIAGAPGDNVALAAALAGKQSTHANLTALAGLTLVANKLIYANGAGTLGLADLTAFARTLLDDANAPTMLSTLGISAFAKTLLDDADASTALSTLGVSAFVKTLLDDADAAAARTTLGAAALNSPTFTGDPKAPTPSAGDNDTSIATTAFVMTAIANLVASSPAALDTLNELAAALGNDPNFATTVTNALAGKQPLNAKLTAFSGLAGAANKIALFTGASTLALATYSMQPPIVIVASGQSNMSVIRDYSWTPPANLKVWNNSQDTAATGTAFASLDGTKMCAAYAYAAEVARANPTRDVYLILVAYQGQPIAQWFNGAAAPNMYAALRANVVAALAAIGVTTIDVFLWWQGENDYLSTTYVPDFTTFHTDLRGETWFRYETPVIMFGLSELHGADYRAFNRNNLAALERLDPECRAYVNTGLFPTSYWAVDGYNYLHMTGQGYEAAGRLAFKRTPIGMGLRLYAEQFFRPKNTGAVTYYVRKPHSDVTVSIATPGVVTQNGHGLANNDPVVLSIRPNTRAVTFSEANPGVATLAGHGFAAGQPIVFQRTGRLPKNVTAGTTYYVIATGLTTDTFRFAATVGGAAIDTSAPAVTVTIASPGVFTLAAHGLAVGDPVYFATTGALPTGLAANTRYFVKTVPTADTFTVAATPDGTAINTTGSQSGTHSLKAGGTHYCSMTGALPTGLVAGTVYYARNVTTNTYQLSATAGGAAINTTGTQSGIVSATTGNDDNDGLSAATPLLGIQAAIDKVAATDLSIYDVTIQLADSVYAENLTLKTLVGAGKATIKGNATYPDNVTLLSSSYGVVAQYLTGRWSLESFKLTGPASAVSALVVASAYVNFLDLEFGAGWTTHVNVQVSGIVSIGASYKVSAGGSGNHFSVAGGGKIIPSNFIAAVAIVNAPTFGTFLSASGSGSSADLVPAFGWTWNGYAKGQRKVVAMNASAAANGVLLPGDQEAATPTPTGGQFA